MSIDNNSECVRSKYFVGQIAMDESLSDFQEAKQGCKGPKPAQKPNKPKTRKVKKHIKGQKDIRTALKGKKNELISYSKEFDTVCKNSGLDVDSEQLQLAIALSKSLQTESSTNPENSDVLSTQDRVAKIRKTLKEYGFKVPDSKITTNKKIKKHRKSYKLLTITEEERYQIITGKFSHILFQNLHCLKLDHNNTNDINSEAKKFNIAANIPYECMKDNSIFYVADLIEQSTTSGSLLRDWAEIPGRPISPNLCDTGTMHFKEIDCSQDELDVILSGPIKSVKDIFATKQIANKRNNRECDEGNFFIADNEMEIGIERVNENENNKIIIDDSHNPIVKPKTKSPFQKTSPVKEIFEVKPPVEEVFEVKSPVREVLVNINREDKDVEASNKLTFTQQYRSCSPDIFDDELSSIMETTKPVNVLSQEHKTKIFCEDNIMDFTQCANKLSQKSEKSIQLSQNVTKRKSNDFMEITECIVGSSQPIHEDLKNIDLTQSPEDEVAIIEDQDNNLDNHVENLCINLSLNDIEQSPYNNSVSHSITNEQTETVQIKHPENTEPCQNLKDLNIDLTQSSNEDDNGITVATENNLISDKREFQNMDLTQSSNSNDIDGLPLVDVSNSQTENSLDNTIIISTEEYMGTKTKDKISRIFENEENNHIDLTQEFTDNFTKSNPSFLIKSNLESCCNSFPKKKLHSNSENTEYSKEYEQYNDLSNGHNNIANTVYNKSNNIDLTQDSDISEDNEDILTSQRPITSIENAPNNSNLGKIRDVSIDYDEIDNNESENENSSKLRNDSSKSDADDDIEIIDSNNEPEVSASQNSEVFNISDKELDYSLQKSRYDIPRDNFDFGGISVLDNVTKYGSFRKSLSEENVSTVAGNEYNYSMADSFLPHDQLEVKGNENGKDTTQTDNKKPDVSSPVKIQDILKNNNDVVIAKTPKNSEYIIKTNNVTPMSDYESMSTPQRNRELDKYGLKPFKRKRAIQILTHIYNQMHPTIQQVVNEDPPSLSKKPRYDNSQNSSPKKLLVSPRNSPLKEQRHHIQASPMKYSGKYKEMRVVSENISTKSPIQTEAIRVVRDNMSEHVLCPKKIEESNEVKDVGVYEVTNKVAVLKDTDCDPDDWVFQKREKAKVHSCRVPLHIAFHNYVLSRRSLREAILKYEPVNIDVIHKDLVGYGHRYDPKDLLKFLDKKCITVKTTDNNSRNNKR